MIGADFMFAPVLDENKNSVGIYLPEGVWIHLWSGKVYTAGRNGLSATVEAPIGRPALFYRAGSRDAENFKATLIDKGILPRERI